MSFLPIIVLDCVALFVIGGGVARNCDTMVHLFWQRATSHRRHGVAKKDSLHKIVL